MRTEILSVTALALAGSAVAQTATAVAAPPGATTVTVVGGQYNGQQISGRHLGAAQNWQTVASPGDSFTYNQTVNQLQDLSVVPGYSMPCYIVSSAQISNNSGPLECGAAGSDSQRQTINLGNDGSVYFVGVQSWWVCSVNTLGPYGTFNGTVVGGFTTDMPVGPAISNCTAVQALKLAGTPTPPTSSSSSSSSATTITVTASSATTSYSFISGVTWSSEHKSHHSSFISGVTLKSSATPTPASSTAPAPASKTSSGSGAATFTGAAATMLNDMSGVAFAAIAGGLALLV